MKNQFALFVFYGTLLAFTPMAWSSDAASDKAQVEQQTITLPELKKAVIGVTGIDDAKLQVISTAHLITITLVDGKLNTADRSEREAEAQEIAAKVEAIVSHKTEFSRIATIHVNYVKSAGKKLKPVQQFDFNKSPAGSFPIHKS
ncbi:hypothetical protein ACO0K0_01325 [Undibacterium sp. SXout11W]|uniref:hypothetical protein n=1 Tax=Undibacterium TaxID=401469 RepID=UPI003BF1ED64